MREPIASFWRVSGPSAATPSGCPAFDRHEFDRQFRRDRTVRWGVLILVVLLVIAGPAIRPLWLLGAVAVVAVAGLVHLAQVSSRGLSWLNQASQRLDSDLEQAEALVARGLEGWPLPGSLRLLLYHRLAVIRLRQGRWTETAAICQSLLEQKPIRTGRLALPAWATISGLNDPVMASLRVSLWLMLAESCLNLGDLRGAYQALTELHRLRLSLPENLQRLAVQSRYELAAGYPRQALANLPEKIRLAELMPAPVCAQVHAWWMQAAEQAGEKELAVWLRRRLELLGPPRLTSAHFTPGHKPPEASSAPADPPI